MDYALQLTHYFSSTVLVIVLLLYIVFSLIIVRQIHLFSAIVIVNVNAYVKFFAYLHLIFALVVSYTILISLII